METLPLWYPCVLVRFWNREKLLRASKHATRNRSSCINGSDIINSIHACKGRTAAPSGGCTSLVKRAVLIHSDTAHPSVHPFWSVRNSVSLLFYQWDDEQIIELTVTLTPAANRAIFKKKTQVGFTDKHWGEMNRLKATCGWKKCYNYDAKQGMAW